MTENLGKGSAFFMRQFGEAGSMCSREEHRLEWPARPERNQHDPVRILEHDAFTGGEFLVEHVEQQGASMFCEMSALPLGLASDERGNGIQSPHLTVRMG